MAWKACSPIEQSWLSGLRPQGSALLVILLDPRGLVVHVEQRIDPLGDDARAKPAGGGVRTLAQDPTVEDELY